MRKTKVSEIQNLMEVNVYLNMPFLPSGYFQFGWSWAFRFYCKMGLILMKPWQASLNKAPGKGGKEEERERTQVHARDCLSYVLHLNVCVESVG